MEAQQHSLLKNRNFMLLWGGQLVSSMGTTITNIALPLIVLALTGSTFQAGSIAAIRGAVYVLWAIPAGALIDRWNRKTVMVIANLGSGLAIGSIYFALLLQHLTIPQLYLVGAIEGSFFVFASLARFTAFPRVVTKEQFPAAVAQTSIADNLAILIGPPLGGLLFQIVGAAFAFLADSLSYFVNAISIFFINVPLQLERTTLKKGFHKDVLEGALFLWRQPMLRFLNLLSAGRTMIESGLYLLIIVVAKEHNTSPFIIGSIFSIAAVGGIIGASLVSPIHKRFSIGTLLRTASMLNFLVFTLYIVASNDLSLAFITAVLFAIFPIFDIINATYTVSVVPDAIRGRITSLTRMVRLGANSLGFFVTGILLHFVGSTSTIIIFSCLLLVLALAVFFYKPLRKI
ncbi:MAG TPA: MFS transporter [Ktedonobacteraceae bacterium]